MNALNLILSLILGIWLGIFYVGAVWLTVRRLHVVRRPRLLGFASMAVRLALCLACFSVVFNSSRWDRLASCALGFVLTRGILSFVLRTEGPAAVGAARYNLLRRIQ